MQGKVQDELVKAVNLDGVMGHRKCIVCGRSMEFDRFVIAFHEGHVCQQCFFEDVSEE